LSEPARPPLSVVVPTHDTRELTLACLAALARQDLSGLEVILVDDASTDGTAEAVAALYPEVRVVPTGGPAGFTRAANLGLRAARGEIALLLNSDTEVDPGGLAALLAAFAADPRLGAAGGALRYPDGRPQWSGGGAPSLAWLFGLASGLPALLGRLPLYRRLRPPAGTGTGAETGIAWVTGAALGLRRAALSSLAGSAGSDGSDGPDASSAPGPLDEAFRFYGQDLDLCLRLARGGWRVAVVPGFGVIHHHGATIGRQGGPSPRGHQNLELLWTDLLYWAGKHHGAAWARRAARAMRLGASLQLAGRSLARLVLPPRDRAAFAAESAALRRARWAIRRPALANPPPLV
jgi:N-acetylglucosaminyl-diphospho-decaprenol L-rhamnosyltransferase